MVIKAGGEGVSPVPERKKERRRRETGELLSQKMNGKVGELSESSRDVRVWGW